jgi:hypothetical protein
MEILHFRHRTKDKKLQKGQNIAHGTSEGFRSKNSKLS